MKSINTLIDDIYGLFEGGQPDFEHKIFQDFGTNLEDIMKTRFSSARSFKPSLRMSNIGKPDRQLWYDFNSSAEEIIPLRPEVLIKFSYGDMLEQLVLMFAKLAGHEVTHEQETIVVDGIEGHIDALIDGCVVDVKSASSFSFQKFATGSLLEGGPKADPFGYVKQISGYAHALTPGKPAYFLAIDKTLGKLCLLEVPVSLIEAQNIPERISYAKEMVKQSLPPERCAEDIPDGKSGNMKLDVLCSYCNHKEKCWNGLKTYYYSTGPRFLTKVVREPKVSNEEYNDFT